MGVALFIWPTGPPILQPQLLSHGSGNQTVPLTLVLRLLASAELWLYWTSLPRLIIAELYDLSGLPLWLDSGCPLST